MKRTANAHVWCEAGRRVLAAQGDQPILRRSILRNLPVVFPLHDTPTQSIGHHAELTQGVVNALVDAEVARSATGSPAFGFPSGLAWNVKVAIALKLSVVFQSIWGERTSFDWRQPKGARTSPAIF